MNKKTLMPAIVDIAIAALVSVGCIFAAVAVTNAFTNAFDGEPAKRIVTPIKSEARALGEPQAVEELEYLKLRTPTGRLVECVTYAGELDCDWSTPLRLMPMLRPQPIPLEG